MASTPPDEPFEPLARAVRRREQGDTWTDEQFRAAREHDLTERTQPVRSTVLAVLGWNELRRSGAMTEASLEREARQFLASARQAIEQRIDLQVPAALAASARLLRDETPTRATIRLREEDGVDAALDLLLLDERGDVQWPPLPLYTYSLPLAREPETPGTSQTGERARFADLAKAELLIANGHRAAAADLLEGLLSDLEASLPSDDGGGYSISNLREAEVHARFRLGALRRADGDVEAARTQFEQVVRATQVFQGYSRQVREMVPFELVAQSATRSCSLAASAISVAASPIRASLVTSTRASRRRSTWGSRVVKG